jgi:phosphotransferase family enzyme
VLPDPATIAHEELPVITDPANVTPALMEEILARGGLSDVRVAAVHLRVQVRGPFSVRAFLDLTYRGKATPAAPTRVFLKLPIVGLQESRDMLREEVRFYQLFGAESQLPIVRCFDAQHSEQTGLSHLVLQDLSDTHTTPPQPMPPSAAQAEAMVDALLRFHLRWWESPELGVQIGERWRAESVVQAVQFTSTHYARFRDLVGERWSKQRWQLYESVLANWPRLLGRLVDQPNLTLIHGDAHVWNCLMPNQPERDPAYLVDLCTCRVRPPTNDLAYMMALMWFPDVRDRWERPLLQRYHEGLLATGIEQYSWQDFMHDYRFAVIVHLFTPVFQASGALITPTTWWYSLERVLAAFHDLDCAQLLDTT